MRKELIIFVFFFASLNLFSQQSNRELYISQPFILNYDNDNVNGIKQIDFKRKRFAGNTIYAELGGFGYYYSVNYEVSLQSIDRRMMTFRIGGGLYSDEEKGAKASKISIPALLYLAFGEDNMFEVGAGITYRIFTENEIIPSASIGFRHQKARGGFMYRFAFTPTVEMNDAGYKDIKLWGGLSLGFSF